MIFQAKPSLRIAILGSALTVLTGYADLRAGDLRVGASQIKITPPDGIPLAGYYSERGSEGVLDDLFARALVFEKDGNQAVMVTLDLITTTKPLVDETRKAIEKQSGIPGAQVLITASHTHTAPVITGRGPRDNVFGGSKDITRQYNASLPTLIAECVEQAKVRLTPASLAVGVSVEKGLAFNRRFFMKDGSVSWNPRKLDPNIVEPAGPVDPEVAVLAVNDPKGKALATLVNFALHPDTVGGTRISADYPGVMTGLVGAWRGGDSVTLFANGACGNINHRDVLWDSPQKGLGEATRIGTILAASAFKAARQLKPTTGSQLRVLSEVVKLPLPTVTPEQLKKATDTIQQVISAEKKPPFMEQVDAFKIADVEGRKGEPWEVEVQVIAVGDDVAIVSLPGEIFVELGLDLKKQSPFKHTLIADLANGSIGYVPTKRAYGQGNYEVVSARCASGSGEMLVDAAVRLLQKLKAQK
ncbi:MAG: hypothetical protein ACAI34_20185 [Verrucomicrobium sp.]|nr:hypothetical protein [Verrucomicrobium sp.]